MLRWRSAALPTANCDRTSSSTRTRSAWLITRPQRATTRAGRVGWCSYAGLLSGIYTIDNMDFVLRDAYMTGYSQRAVRSGPSPALQLFQRSGLTIHDRGIDALLRFMTVRAELFRTIYFHRTVRAIDLTLADLFAASRPYLFPGNPLDALARIPATDRMVPVCGREPMGGQ